MTNKINESLEYYRERAGIVIKKEIDIGSIVVEQAKKEIGSSHNPLFVWIRSNYVYLYWYMRVYYYLVYIPGRRNRVIKTKRYPFYSIVI